MKKPLGMRKERKTKTIHMSTFGPHQLQRRSNQQTGESVN